MKYLRDHDPNQETSIYKETVLNNRLHYIVRQTLANKDYLQSQFIHRWHIYNSLTVPSRVIAHIFILVLQYQYNTGKFWSNSF